MFLCLGTTPTVQQTMLFARVTPDEVNRAVEVRRSAAGKPVNVARVLHTLGDPAVVCVPLGKDTGRFLSDDLVSAGVAVDPVETTHPTRTCVTVVDREKGTATELVEEHAELAIGVREKMLQKVEAHLPKCQMLIASGTLAPGSGDDFYAETCRLAGARGVPVILDTRRGPLLRALQWHPLLIKPNRSELAATLGTEITDDASLKSAMHELVDRGAKWVLITMGKQAAALTNGRQYWKIPTIPVAAISPIGSGDAFAAGLASAIAVGRDIPDACRLGAACAAANTLIPGAGFLKIDDVQKLQPLARLESW